MTFLVNCDECIQSENKDGSSSFTHSPHSFAAKSTLNELLERIYFTQQEYNRRFPHTKAGYRILSISELPDDTNLGRLADLQVEILGGILADDSTGEKQAN